MMMRRYFAPGLAANLVIMQLALPLWSAEPDAFQFFEEEAKVVSIATKIEQSLDAAPADVTVVTENEIKNMGARNLSDVLATVAGVDVAQSPNYNDVNVGVNGMTLSGNEVKVMLNGHTLDSFTGGPLQKYFDFIPVENIRKIEIVRGPGSALYGTGAFLGVINIITKDKIEGGKQVQVTQKFGSDNTVKSVLEVAPHAGDFKGYLLGSFNKSDGPRLSVASDRATQLFGPTHSEAPGCSAGDFTDYTLQSNLHYKDFYLSGFFNRQGGASPVGISSALTPDNSVDMQTYFLETGYKKRVFDDGHIAWRAYYDAFQFNPTFETFGPATASLFSHLYPATPYPSGEGIYGEPSGRLQNTGTELTIDNQVLSALHLLGGASFEAAIWDHIQNVTNGDTTGAPLTYNGITYKPNQYLGGFQNISSVANWSSAANRNTTAVYGEGTLDLKKVFPLENAGPVLALTSGLRYDHYSDVGGSVNPSAALVYSPVEKLSLKGIYGSAFRAPSMQELRSINNPAYIGNPDLKPETIQTVQGLIGYQFTEALKGSLTYFHNRAHNLIMFAEGAATNQVQNVERINTNGISAEFKYNLDQYKYAYVNGTYQRVRDVTHGTITSATGATYTQGDFNPGSNPAVMANVGATCNVTRYIIPNLALNFVGDRPRTEQKQFNSSGALVPVDARDRLPARALVNLVTTLKNFDRLPGLELRLGIYNLFNTDYRDPDPTGALADDVPRPGINFLGDISYRF
jgi:iron complex outermembrane receptor protein